MINTHFSDGGVCDQTHTFRRRVVIKHPLLDGEFVIKHTLLDGEFVIKHTLLDGEFVIKHTLLDGEL